MPPPIHALLSAVERWAFSVVPHVKLVGDQFSSILDWSSEEKLFGQLRDLLQDRAPQQRPAVQHLDTLLA